MACFYPLQGFRSKTVNPSGKRSIVFDRNQGFTDMPIEVPCGRCIGCRLEKSRQWAIRIIHEASLYQSNYFVTLTYDREHLPKDRSINKEDPVLFMKRLRKEFGAGVRSYGCAEYGERFRRPHYHLCLFNVSLPDLQFWKRTGPGSVLYTSESLARLWPFGFHSVGDLTFESAAYVARYVTKKITGDLADEHYEYVDPASGEVFQLAPERSVCVSRGSRKLGTGGVGRAWLEKFTGDVYPCDEVLLRGVKLRPPKYYDYRYDIDYPDDCARVKARRKEKLLDWQERNSDVRASVAEKLQQDRFSLLKRGYEDAEE